MSLFEQLSSLAQRFLDQDQDLAFGFEAAAGRFTVVGFSVQEAINTPFEIVVDLASLDPDIDLAALLDAPACLGLYSKYQAPRHFHGIVTDAMRGDSGYRRTFYTLVLRPSLSRLDHGSDWRIWQDMTVPEVAAQLLSEQGVTDVDWRLAETYLPREYLTQAGETNRAFLERILAEEGIFYAFAHSPDGHKLIVTDAPLAMPMIADPVLAYNANPGGQSRGVWVSRFSQTERLRASHYAMEDYTFHNPPAGMGTLAVGERLDGLKGRYEHFAYPGRYKDPASVGNRFTRHRIEAERVDATTGAGETNCLHLNAAFQMTLAAHTDPRANSRHRLLAVSHSGQQSAALEEDAGDAPTTYSASFVTKPGHLPYRPAVPRKPVVDGPQMAVVTGPPGEEIYCDNFGRVKVQFEWNRHTPADEHSSCWIRVSQNWGGGGWGHMAIPRIGQEVIVDFFDGDADQPIITGRTYNARNRPPYKLPEHKTKMVIRSDTHKGSGFNELSFEDEAGRENIALHAQKDQTLKVLNNRMKRIDNDQIESVGSNKAIEVGSNHQEKIGGSMNLSVGGGPLGLFGLLGAVAAAGGQDALAGSEAVGNPIISKFVGALAAAGAAAEVATLGGNAGFSGAGGNRREAGAAQSSAGSTLGSLLSSVMPMSGIKTTMVEKLVSDTIGLARTEQIGAYKNTSVGHTMTVHVGKEFIINVGKSKFVMDSDGNVTIIGTKFNFAASGHVQINGKIIDLN